MIPLWDKSQVEHHPTRLCESVNLSLASLPVVNVTSQRLESSVISPFQHETIERILSSFRQRGCFLLGDGTGVGKGRTIAGLILKLMISDPTTKIVWISASNRLRVEAMNEWREVGGEGVVSFASCVYFCGYSSLLGPKTCPKILEWFTSTQRRLLVLDECHSLKNSTSRIACKVDQLSRSSS